MYQYSSANEPGGLPLEPPRCATLHCALPTGIEQPIGPNLFAILVAAGNRPRGSWIVWREGKVPSLVVEIASESTWDWDADENGTSTQGWALPNTDGSIPRAGGHADDGEGAAGG
jgi:hypothetical protein